MWHPNGEQLGVVSGTCLHRESCMPFAGSSPYFYAPHIFTVYPDGNVCISILHAPGDDPSGYELASERWSPVHTVSLWSSLQTLAPLPELQAAMLIPKISEGVPAMPAVVAVRCNDEYELHEGCAS